ncbi:hypothetical protein C2S02_07435 [Helicobacter pylori]|nr:hypothetical protein C2S02_07435 [Helicobacter pylori]
MAFTLFNLLRKTRTPRTNLFNDHKRLLSHPFIPNAKSGFRLVFKGLKQFSNPLKKGFFLQRFQ